MLLLRRGVVREAGALPAAEQSLLVDLDGGGGCHPAIADTALVGPCKAGDQVVVNVQSRLLGLGSGGFDVVHVNLTRGLDSGGAPGAHVMKLNYTSLQHAVIPVEGVDPGTRLARPVAVLALHGQLAPLAWAFGGRLGYVQTGGGALSGSHSRVAAELLDRGLLVGHITAAPAFGGLEESITTAGALVHGLGAADWTAAVCGPGPGIVGSASALGHGGLEALDSAHAALALGAPTLLAPRMSDSDPRPRHRPISHHTRTVLDLLLAPAVVALPPGEPAPQDWGSRHDWRTGEADLIGYRASGLPTRSMGREDELFLRAALASGAVLGNLVG
ncbi:MAG: DUF3866 family protein [Solirubrobacteraceae bacterium]